MARPTAGASTDPFLAAAELHAASIQHGLLPELGRGFLARLYREIDRTPRAGVWVAVDDDRVVGFVAGSADPRRCYRSVLGRAGLPLALRAGPALFRGSVLTRIPTVLTYPFRRSTAREDAPELPVPELLAIAVHPAVRGQGVGGRLVAAFEAGLRDWGIEGRYRVATNVEESGSNRFYAAMGFEPACRVAHNDLVLQVHVKEIPAG